MLQYFRSRPFAGCLIHLGVTIVLSGLGALCVLMQGAGKWPLPDWLIAVLCFILLAALGFLIYILIQTQDKFWTDGFGHTKKHQKGLFVLTILIESGLFFFCGYNAVYSFFAAL